MSNHDLQSLKRAFRNLNRLANFDGGIDSHYFFRTHSGLKPNHNIFGLALPSDHQSGRSLEFRENFQRHDVVSNRQISRTDSRETSPLRTRLAPFGSSCGNASEARNTRRQTDAGARSPPNARALAAPSDRTKLAHRAAQARQMTASHSQLRHWESQVPKHRQNSHNFFFRQ